MKHKVSQIATKMYKANHAEQQNTTMFHKVALSTNYHDLQKKAQSITKNQTTTKSQRKLQSLPQSVSQRSTKNKKVTHLLQRIEKNHTVPQSTTTKYHQDAHVALNPTRTIKKVMTIMTSITEKHKAHSKI